MIELSDEGPLAWYQSRDLGFNSPRPRPTVWTSVGKNNYAQWNMRGRDSNSRPPDSDTKLKGPLYQSNYITQVI
jgi:hypothetical protein